MGKICIGTSTSEIRGAYLGNKKLAKIYVGTHLVYSNIGILEVGNYNWLETITMPTSQIEQPIAFTSNNITYTNMRITTDTIYYVKSDGTETEVYNTSSKWVTADIANQTISLSVSQGVAQEFYDWAITGGNLVKN